MITKDKKGFTLIEILIVVAIIAILASVVLVGLGPTQRAGRDARRISDMRQTQTGLELYYNRCGFYPGTGLCAAATAQPGGAAASAVSWTFLRAAFTGTPTIGVTAISDDPNTKQHYQYGVVAPNSTYAVGAQLEDVNNAALAGAPAAAINGVPCNRVTGFYCLQL